MFFDLSRLDMLKVILSGLVVAFLMYCAMTAIALAGAGA